MSALNAFKTAKTGYIYTDTAHLNSDSGKVVAFGSKAFTAANWPAVVGATFSGGVMPFLIDFFVASPPKNLPALRRMLPAACRRFVELSKLEGNPDPYVRLVAVAWCKRTQSMRMFYCSTHDSGPLGKAYNPVEIDFFVSTGVGIPTVEAAMETLKRGGTLDPDRQMIELMEAQRKAPFQAEAESLRGLPDLYGIGGSIERLTVTPREVLADTLHTWPDKVGERIKPARHVASMLHGAAGSRAETAELRGI